MRSPSAEGGSPARPWAATSLLVNYENGQILSQVTRPMNAFDSLALWQARGSGVMNDAFWTTGACADGINRSTAVKTLYVTNGNGAAPFVLTTRNAANYRLLESTYDDLNLPADARAGLSLVPASQIPFRYSTYGPGAGRDTNLDRVMATLEQRLGRTVTLELAYNRERSKQWVKAPVNNSVLLTGDPNLVIPDPAGGAVPVPNPNVRGLYLESRWVIDRGQTGNDVARASLAWALDLDRWGRHQLAGMVERGRLTAFRYPGAEILVDAAGVPIGNAANPENAANFVFRRQYVVPGNFDTYFVGKGTDDFTVVRDGRTYRNEFIYTSVAGGFITRRIDTLLAATQSSFLDQRLIVTAGLRGDRIRFDQHGDTRLSADDPDVRAGRAIRNTVRFTSEVVDRTEFRPVTGTVGGVYHATRALSFFYNRANNNSQPPLNARVLPDERLPPPFDGESQDYGLMLNLLDGRAFLRATAFATSQLRSSGRTPNGNRIYGETYYGPEDFKADAFAGYRRPVRLGRRAGEFTAQLNVTNVTDEDVVMPLRYNALKSGYTRVLLFEPRRFRLTLGLGF